MTDWRILLTTCILAAVLLEVQSLFLPKRADNMYIGRERVLADPKKRPFCNAFTGCGRKRSNLPPLAEPNVETIDSLLDLSAEPAVEDLSRQIMSEAKLWEAIQEANIELLRRKQETADANAAAADMGGGYEEDDAVPARSATASCALPPCYI